MLSSDDSDASAADAADADAADAASSDAAPSDAAGAAAAPPLADAPGGAYLTADGGVLKRVLTPGRPQHGEALPPAERAALPSPRSRRRPRSSTPRASGPCCQLPQPTPL